MIEKVRYINHINQMIKFGEDGIYINQNDLHDFIWNVISKNNRISSFSKGITKYSIPVVIAADSDENGITNRNNLFEICEKDVIAGKHGKLVIGDYYMKCFITGSKSSNYAYNKRYIKITLTVQTDFPQWVKETITTFFVEDGAYGKNLDYENDFPYDYTSNIMNKRLINTDIVPTNFRIRIYGPCENPSVTIGGHIYSVDITIGYNEYIQIDSIEKTIELHKQDGTIVNCFKYRNKDSYVFEKIQPGTLSVATSTAFTFDVTLLEERSVPKWI